jgi:flagellar hook-associated protein 3 FlgL
MQMSVFSDRATQFTSMRQGSAIKSDLARLAASLSSGRVSDPVRHLGGETARLTGAEYSLSQLAGFERAAVETAQVLTAQQTSLTQVARTRSDLAAELLLISDASQPFQLDQAGRAARDGLERLTALLNTRIADRAIFGGQSVDGPPLAPAATMIADLVVAIGTQTSAADISATIDSWFDDPAGGFATTGYLGDIGALPQRQLSESRRISIEARADDPALRDVLKATAKAAVTSFMASLPLETKLTLLKEAGQDLFIASAGLTAMQARTGTAEQATAEAQSEMAARKTALQMFRNDLITADPFDTATRLQATQLQLEKHYTVVGRLSQLSLVRFI